MGLPAQPERTGYIMTQQKAVEIMREFLTMDDEQFILFRVFELKQYLGEIAKELKEKSKNGKKTR